MKTPSLIADDRLLIYAGAEGDVSPVDANSITWRSIQIPTMYLSENWPVRVSSYRLKGLIILVPLVCIHEC